MIAKIVSIALLLCLAACSSMQDKEPRTLLCEYYDASLVLTCGDDIRRCELVCKNIQENLQIMDMIKLQMMEQQRMMEESLQGIDMRGHQI